MLERNISWMFYWKAYVGFLLPEWLNSARIKRCWKSLLQNHPLALVDLGRLSYEKWKWKYIVCQFKSPGCGLFQFSFDWCLISSGPLAEMSYSLFGSHFFFPSQISLFFNSANYFNSVMCKQNSAVAFLGLCEQGCHGIFPVHCEENTDIWIIQKSPKLSNFILSYCFAQSIMHWKPRLWLMNCP